jgi:predicted CxxxxCH...CXXCH cytochrome family protein
MVNDMLSRTSIRTALLRTVAALGVAALAAPGVAGAAVALGAGGWSAANAGSGTANLTKPADAGTNRQLVVLVAGSGSGTTTTAPACSGTYGGQSLTQRADSGTSASTRRKACILTLSEAGIAAASSTTLSVSMTSPAMSGLSVQAAFFTGVDQATPIGAARGNASSNNQVAFGASVAASAGGAYAFLAAGRNNATSTAVASGSGLVYTLAGFSATNAAIGAYYRIAGGGNESDDATVTINGNTSDSALAVVALNPSASGTTTVGNGTDPSSVTIAPGAATTDLDSFTLQTSSGTDTITAVTVQLAAGTAQRLQNVLVTNDAGSVTYGTVASPGSDTVAIALSTSITATTGATQYKVRLVPLGHAAMPAVPGGAYAVTGRVTAITSGNTKVYNDGGSATVTIDNQSPADPTGFAAAGGANSVNLSWTNPGADFSQVVILERSGTAVGDVPVEGTSYSSGNVIGSSTVRYVGAGTSTALGGKVNGTTYHYRIFAQDPSGNFSTPGVAASATPSAPATTTVGDGTNPGNSTVGPSTAAVLVDAFSLQTSSGSDTVTGVTVTLAAGTSPAIGLVEITNTAGTIVYGSAVPAASTVAVPLGTSILATTALTQYRVRLTPASHAAMPPVPGGTYLVTAVVSAITSTNAATYGDTASATLTIDNQSPADPTALSAIGGNAVVNLSWTNPVADFSQVVVLEQAGTAVTFAPVEGATYSLGAQPVAGTFVRFVGTGTSTSLGGKTNGTTYHYKVFAQDANGNWSTPGAAASATPSAGATTTVGNGTDPASVTIAPGAAYTDVDQFTLATSTGTDTVTAVTVSLAAGTNVGLGGVRITSSSGATVYGTASNPATTTVAITLTTSIPVTTTPTTYKVQVAPKNHSAMPAVPGAEYPVTALVTAASSTNPRVFQDTSSATVTVDNLSPGNVSGLTATPGDGQVVLAWANPGDADLAQVVVFEGTAAVTSAPVEGTTYAVGNVLGNGTVVYAGTGVGITLTGKANGTQYFYRVYTRDLRTNWSPAGVSASATPTATAPPSLVVGDGTNPGAASICPGGAATPLDGFRFTVDVQPDTVSRVTVTLTPAGSFVNVGLVEVLNAGNAVLGSAIPGSDVVNVYLAPPLSLAVGATDYTVRVTPRSHAAMPGPDIGQAFGVQGTVTSIASANPRTYLDATSGTVTIDNLSPANATVTAVSTPTATSASLTWAPSSAVLILRRQGGPVLDAPAEGNTGYAVGSAVGSSTVRFNATNTTFTDTGLTTGATYYYKVFARDACGNYATGVQVGPVTPGAVVEGDPAGGSLKPVVAILNPMNGAVVTGGSASIPLRVQVRAFSPKNGGAAQPFTAVRFAAKTAAQTFVATCDAANYPYAPAVNTRYPNVASESGTWELSVTNLAAGAYTLRACAANASGTVVSAPATVELRAGSAGSRGDGNLLARDNSAQLCSDCHDLQTHSSEAVGNRYGSWFADCRTCHQPHGTTNISLVRTQITPPAVNGPQAPHPVDFRSNATGYTTGGAPAYANSAATGVCQVCHTRTTYYRQDGTLVTHNPTQACTTCHTHGRGLSASCTACHGTDGRVGVAGADALVAAAPPVGAGGENLTTQRAVGAHQPHVNQATFRASPIQCSDCHPIPNTHQGTRDMAWSALATGAGAVSPSWSGTGCASTWCHGAGLAGGGGTITTPNWTASGQAACGTCHASPPPVSAAATQDHPQNTACATCHGTGYAQAGVTGAALTSHVDGTIQKPANGCTACHGVLAGLAGAAVANTSPTAAPGYDASAADTRGRTATTFASVGAHQAHVNPSASQNWMAAQGCAVCHGSLPGAGDTTHANGTILAGFTAPANAYGVTVAPAAFNAAWEASPTCTNACHSNAGPLGGSLATAAPTWTSATNMTCTSCHGGAASGTLSSRHAKHVTAGTYALDCARCHSATGTAATITTRSKHVNGTKNVAFDATPVNQASATYTGPATYTCNSTYCHSNGTTATAPFGAPVNLTLNWSTGTSPVDCSGCHGGNASAVAVLATGSHTAHVNQASYIGTNLGCVTCHAATVSADRTILAGSGFASHVNGQKNVSAASWNGASCATNACHSSGQASPQFYSASWGTPIANDCKGCHGRYAPQAFASVAGEPNYASGAAGSATANSHQKHVGSAADCQNCHSGTATPAGTAIVAGSALHVNGARDITILASWDTNGATSNYTAGTKTCNSVSCHGTGTPQWGGTALACGSCHQQATGEVNDWVLNNGVTATINTAEWTTYGHGKAAINFGAVNPCLYCHDSGVPHQSAGTTNPFRLRGASVAGGTTGTFNATVNFGNAVCLNCHATTNNGVDPDGSAGTTYVNRTSTLKVNAWHYGADHTASGTNGGQRCWDCHDPHGDGTNLAMIGSDVIRTSTDAYGLVATRAGTAPVLTTRNTAASYVRTTAPYTGVCQVCHTGTTYWTSTGGGTTHNTTTDCMSCHAHDNANQNLAFQGAGDCIGCHTGPQGTRRAIVPEFALTWSHKRSAGGAVTKEDCAVCHLEGNTSDGSVNPTYHLYAPGGPINLRDPDTGANIKQVTWGGTGAGVYTSTATDATFVQFSRDLSSNALEPAVQAIMINQCLKCHDGDGALSPLARVPGGSAGKPFNTTIAGTGYNGGTGLTACASGTNGCVTNVDASFATTNASYHPIKGKQNNSYVSSARMKAPWNGITKTGGNTTSWGYLISCWDCHAPNNASGVQTSTVTAHGGAVTLRQDIWVASTSFTGAVGAGNLCLVCHTVATSGNNHASGSAWASGGNSTPGSQARNMCYSCHSSSIAKPARPTPGQDVHGFDGFALAAGTDTMWPVGATNTYKPYGFMRSVSGSGGRWTTTSWKPLSGPGVTSGSATCGGSGSLGSGCSNQNHGTYTPGGVY